MDLDKLAGKVSRTMAENENMRCLLNAFVCSRAFIERTVYECPECGGRAETADKVAHRTDCLYILAVDFLRQPRACCD